MIHNFQEIKIQLGELSSVINSFKSEAVQLKIIELIFTGKRNDAHTHAPSPATDEPQIQEASSKKREAKKRKKSQSPGTEAKGNKPPSGNGAVATLLKVFHAGFFKEARTINAILQHCEINLARKIKANEISGKLARMVRSNQLKRSKNSDGQYEYTNHE